MAEWAWHYTAICRDFDGLVFISGFSCNERFIIGPPMIEDPKEPGTYIDDPNAPPMPDLPKLKIGASEIGITLVGIPLVILAMGWLTAWVIRGFRSRVE
jgi:hypothetical protein